MQAELDALSKALEKPARPLAAIVGGAKISSKLDLLGNLLFLRLGAGLRKLDLQRFDWYLLMYQLISCSLLYGAV